MPDACQAIGFALKTTQTKAGLNLSTMTDRGRPDEPL